MLLKRNDKRGFTLAELLIVVAMIAVLSGIAFVFVKPQDVSYVENNRSAEAIATAVQNRLTEIRNTGDMDRLRSLGEQASDAGVSKLETSSEPEGGYRYVFSYTEDSGTVSKNADINYILPFGSIEYDLSQNYIAIGFQSDTGMVGEVFYSEQPFGERSADYLVLLQDEEKRKSENVGYYKGSVNNSEIAFANLPTPQLSITNYEELTLSIYLPEVKQLKKYGKQLGILISLSDEDGKAYSEKKLKLAETAIYSTFSLGRSATSFEEDPVVKHQAISSGATYTVVLDTVKSCLSSDMQNNLASFPSTDTPPKGKFEDWAKKSKAFQDGIFLLGDNSVITVTVYCLENLEDDFPINPTFMPRSASVTFNGWFDHYADSSVDIACGRHLQNLAKLTEMRQKLTKYLPKVTTGKDEYVYPDMTKADSIYEYGDYNYGMADTYTNESSSIDTTINKDSPDYKTDKDPNVYYDDITEKFVRRSHTKKITKAQQINAIDFDCPEWKNMLFTPICLPKDFIYYGNYLTISHLHVDSPLYAGLFGYVYHPKLYDILLVNPSVTSQAPARLAELYEIGVGALIGTSRDSSDIYNCQVYMTPDGKTGEYDSTLRVQGECYVGGLIGFCEDEDIKNCSASVYTGYAKNATKKVAGADGTEVDIPVSSRYVGGLLGCITGDSEVESCYAAGNLTGEYVGGLVGYIVEDSDPSGDDYRIETCYTAGHIEYAAKNAAGILGCIRELGGNAKSALSIYGNYCVVIYGKKSGEGYQWEGDAPIYGTFEGDGFEWIRTDDMNFSDTYLTGKYSQRTFFTGAVFEIDNKNYYIAQDGITYANSSYMTSMKNEVENILSEIQGATNDELNTKITSAQEKIFWLKKLQSLEELKECMENIIYEVESESGNATDGTPYYYGGYSGHGKTIYLSQNRARVEGDKDSGHNQVALNLLQALHAIYEGKYTDGDGEHTVTLTYEGDSHNDWTKAESKIDTYTFMGFYQVLQQAYKDLSDDSADNDAAAKETLKKILGDDNEETYIITNSSGKEETHSFYEKGLFYQIFYHEMLYSLFDHAKDYYENSGDKNGELIYRHFREDLAQSKFLDLLCDLGISAQGRDKFLRRIKSEELQKTIDALNASSAIIGKWNNQMASEKEEAQKLVSAATTALDALKTAVNDEKTLPSKRNELMKSADDALKNLYDFYDDDAHKNKIDYIGTQKNQETGKEELVTGDMRNFRSPISGYRRSVALCAAHANSGVEGALEELAENLKEKNANQGTLKAEFERQITKFLSSDSGQRLKNAEEIRNAVRGYPTGKEEGTREENLGFMYDYGNDDSGSPYYGKLHNSSFVDQDNQVYNNVFPYEEGENTKYYPFPFVFGRKVEDTNYQASFILFHYGDWLTQELWAK